ncbi:ADP-ribosyl-[dinitrogen reductase] glycohydrolase [Balamuthia mandrillaris]
MEGREQQQRDRFRGCLLGLAAGDALGTTLEFLKADPDHPLTDMVGGGKYALMAGQWTDDTSMALCLAESLIECRGTFDPCDQLRRYCQWYREGHLSSNGECFDIGITTRMSMFEFEKTGNPYPASTGDKARAGNGSLMRLCPVPLLLFFLASSPSNQEEQRMRLLKTAEDSSRTTHGAQACLDACRFYAALLVGALQPNITKEELLSPSFFSSFLSSSTETAEQAERSKWLTLVPEVEEVANGSYKHKEPPEEITGKGYVVSSLEAALWAFHKSNSFEEGALLVANLGDDADTTTAIYGQVAGAFYGAEAIPEGWRRKLALAPLIEAFADELYSLSQQLRDGGEVVLSENYRAAQTCYQLLEKGWQPIQRRLTPGPRMYTSVTSFLNDESQLKQHYFEALASSSSSPFGDALWQDFEHRFRYVEQQLRNRTGEVVKKEEAEPSTASSFLPPPPPAPLAPPPLPLMKDGEKEKEEGRGQLLSAIQAFSKAGLSKTETKDKSGLILPEDN